MSIYVQGTHFKEFLDLSLLIIHDLNFNKKKKIINIHNNFISLKFKWL